MAESGGRLRGKLRSEAVRVAADGRERSGEGQPAVEAAAVENHRSLALFPDGGQVYTPRRECSARRPLVCGLWGPDGCVPRGACGVPAPLPAFVWRINTDGADVRDV